MGNVEHESAVSGARAEVVRAETRRGTDTHSGTDLHDGASSRPAAAPGEPAARRRRPARRTRDELRTLLVQAGAEMLWEQGLAAGAEHLTFKRVFQHLERTSGVRVTHASVIGRIWPNQEEFQTEVLTNLAALETPDVDAEVEAALTGLEDLDVSTPEARWRTALDICRRGGEASFRTIVASRTWPRWMGLWALAVVDVDSVRKRPIVEALVRAEAHASDCYEARYGAAMAVLGLRMRAPFTVRQFAVAIDAFTEGCALRAGVDPTASHPIGRPTGPGGAEEEWTLFAVGLEALVRQFVEPDPARAAA